MTIDTQNIASDLKTAFEEFKAAQDERQAAMAKRESVAEVDVKVERINSVLDTKSQELEDLQINSDARMSALEETIAKLIHSTGSKDTWNEGDRYNSRVLNASIQKKNVDDVEPMTREMYAEYVQGFRNYIKRGRIDNALTVGTDSAGGFFVHPDLSGAIIELVRESSPVRELATVTSISTERLKGYYDLNEFSAGWISETGTRAVTDTPTVGEWEVPVHEVYAAPQASTLFLDTASEVQAESWIVSQAGRKIGREEAKAFVTGDGSGKPAGVAHVDLQTTHPTASEIAEVKPDMFYVPTGHATNAPSDAAALIKLVTELKGDYQPNATWAMNRGTLSSIRALKDTVDGFVFQPDFSMSPFGSILGRPVRIFEDMAALGTNNNLVALYGDFRAAYQIVDHSSGLRLVRDNVTSRGNVIFYIARRTGGKLVNSDALKALKQGAT